MPDGADTIDSRLRETAHAVTNGQVAQLAANYERRRDLARLRAPERLCDGQARQVTRWLRKALRRERAKALAGHWSYDANRHLALRAALQGEAPRQSGT